MRTLISVVAKGKFMCIEIFVMNIVELGKKCESADMFFFCDHSTSRDST